MIKGIDLFCGCGGISSGLSMSGVEIICGADIESKYLSTFTHNYPNSLSLNIDLSKTDPFKFMKTLSIDRGEIDILAGGPPCQGFSKNTPRKNRSLDSDNNLLVKTFLDYCEAIFPKIIIMENVAEIKNGFDKAYTTEIINRLNNLGYSVTYDVLNAADYGIPQLRKRAFFIANKYAVELKFPQKTHYPKDRQLNFIEKKHYIDVWSAIGDLPRLNHGEGEEVCKYAVAPFSEYQKIVRNGSCYVKNHISRSLKPKQHARLASLAPGEGLKDLPRELQVKSGYSGAYGRLSKDMVCRTITRWVFHPGSGRWGHPVDTRVLSIREVARIQGFLDSYEFIGSYTQQAGQLGNAVPPLLVKTIASSILTQLKGYI